VVGRLDGFRFRVDKSDGGQEAKTLQQAAMQALTPHFALRADRFYNAPDTEIDYTEQGGLMWGEHAVGKLVAGADPLKPQVQAFVDEEAGADVIEKVTRRLQHFIDRKIATLYEPLLNLSRDEELTGPARGFAFRLVETLGIIPREDVAQDVKALDQDARGALRKHGVRFGQFTIFMPLLLKPAPTRLRLVLWSLSKGLQEFPESPPPGLVTVPNPEGAIEGAAIMSGYRPAGERAIRIDMLERLADLLRAQDSRKGFEANPDMLSITGMTLEQFSGLMQGLGYRAEQGERVKVKPVDTAAGTETVEDKPVSVPGAEATPAEAVSETPEDTGAVTGPDAADAPEAAADIGEAMAPAAAVAAPDEAAADAPQGEDAPEMEVFFTFTWGGFGGGNRGGPRREGGNREGGSRDGAKREGAPKGRPRNQKSGKPPRRDGKPGGKPGAKSGAKPQGARRYESKPDKKDKIDPDNPFAAALMGLKDKS